MNKNTVILLRSHHPQDTEHGLVVSKFNQIHYLDEMGRTGEISS